MRRHRRAFMFTFIEHFSNYILGIDGLLPSFWIGREFRCRTAHKTYRDRQIVWVRMPSFAYNINIIVHCHLAPRTSSTSFIPHNTPPQYLLTKFSSLADPAVCFYFYFPTPHVSFLPQPHFLRTYIFFSFLLSLAHIVSNFSCFFFLFLRLLRRPYAIYFWPWSWVLRPFFFITIAIVDVCDLLSHKMRALSFI